MAVGFKKELRYVNMSHRQIDSVRKNIQTNRIIQQLQKHIDNEDHSSPIMSPSQVTAALGLLRKTIPDLSVTTLSGDPDNPLVLQHSLIDQAAARMVADPVGTMGQLVVHVDAPLEGCGRGLESDLSSPIPVPRG